jgi:hypothetical protein
MFHGFLSEKACMKTESGGPRMKENLRERKRGAS